MSLAVAADIERKQKFTIIGEKVPPLSVYVFGIAQFVLCDMLQKPLIEEVSAILFEICIR
jgi:hypothetical protein